MFIFHDFSLKDLFFVFSLKDLCKVTQPKLDSTDYWLTWLVHMSVSSIDDLQGPTPFHLLTPEVHTQEWPVVEVGADNISGSLKQESRGGSHRRGE